MLRNRLFVFAIILIVGAAMAVTLPSCSKKGGGGATSGSADTSEILIGGLFDLTGKAQNIGAPTKDVAEMVIDQINKEGGIDGRMLKLVTADTESEPSKAAVALQRLISKDKVVAVIGPTTTGAAMACLSAVEEAQIPMVATVGGDGPVTPTQKWVFKSPQRTTTAVQRLYTYLRDNKLNRVGLLIASDKFGQEGEAALKTLSAEYGIDIIAQESFDPKAVDMTVQVSKVAKAKPQAMIVWTIGPAGAVIAKNVKAANVAIPLFQCHGQPDANYLKLAGPAAEGTMMPATKLMVAAQLPDADKQKAVEMAFIKEYNTRKLGTIGTHSGYAWDAIQLIAAGLKEAGTDPVKLRDAIENVKGYVGVSGIYTMSQSDHCGLDVDSLVMVKVVKGDWMIIE